MKQNLLLFWNFLWKYHIDSFKKNNVTYDIIDVCRYFDKSEFVNNGRNKFTYDGPYWNEQTEEDKENILTLYKKVLYETKYDYIFPNWMDSDLPALAYANEYYKLKGLKPKPLKSILGKSVYGEILKELNIPVPKVYEDTDRAEFPIICKPSFGSAGEGIKICYNLEELTNFLFDPDNKKYHPYILQEYILGSTVEVIGKVVGGEISIDLILDIETSKSPYCAEIGYTFPSSADFIEYSVKKDIEKFINHIELDDTPFMLDLIVDKDGKYYFIDFSPRVSFSIYLLIHYMGNADYCYNIANKILNNVDYTVKKQKSVIHRHFCFEPGIVNSIEYANDENIKELRLPKISDTIKEIKNDFDVASNSYFCIIVGDSLVEAEKTWDNINKSIIITYK
jgi:predicted ATP-grasp superfamily ATP-dependent carboligase